MYSLRELQQHELYTVKYNGCFTTTYYICNVTGLSVFQSWNLRTHNTLHVHLELLTYLRS
jgi:hypothetical protein